MIELQNIDLSVGQRQILKDVSLQIAKGGRLLIRGDSGTGKSTILRLILGLVQPDNGRVIIDQKVQNKHNIWSQRLKMAYVSQDMQLGRGKTESFIKEVFSYRNNRHLVYDRKELAKYFDLFGMNGVGPEHRLEDLSGGELQRVAIITALLLKRPIYLLDEITSALDANLKAKITGHFLSMKNATLVIVSHDQHWYEHDIQTLTLDS